MDLSVDPWKDSMERFSRRHIHSHLSNLIHPALTQEPLTEDFQTAILVGKMVFTAFLMYFLVSFWTGANSGDQ